MDKIIGREVEQQQLAEILASKDAELLAVYGRRRVGKTFLIRQVYQQQLAFEFTGLHHGSLSEQLDNFTQALWSVASAGIGRPGNWLEAFTMLSHYLSPLLKKEKRVIFLDEFPWTNTPRSKFLDAFGHFWNTWASRQPNLVVVICGSAASWMIQHVLNNKGGLHNRVTRRMRLLPFSVSETAAYLRQRNVRLDHYQLLELYMAMGGVPQYLREIKAGESSVQAINRICFTKDGFLNKEFPNLFFSLFDGASHHTSVVKALAKKGKGLTRTEIITECNINSGGGATQILEELTESGFITPYIPFDRTVKDSIYKLTDEYSLFYIRFIEGKKYTGVNAWERFAGSSSWKTWSGYAFESICLKHIQQIKRALGIERVYTEASVWRHHGSHDSTGAQIDLLIDRDDRCINLCEIKFTNTEFVIDKKYAGELDNKVKVFREQTNANKAIFLTMVTTYGVKKNDHYTGRVQSEVMMTALFQ